MLTFENKAEVEASSAIPGGDDAIQVLGYAAAGDGGGALYKRAAAEPPHAGKIEDANDDWWELAELVVNPLMFGCDPTGTAECGAQMNDFFRYCIDKTDDFLQATQVTNAGHIPAGTYKIDWGTLVFDTAPVGDPDSPERLAWPDIGTDGAPETTFLGSGAVDAPMITFRNGEPTEAIDRTWMGGRLGALRIIATGDQTGKSGRHGLSLLGLHHTRFDGIFCEDNPGSAVFIPNMLVDGTNPDPHHVAACHFGTISGIRLQGTRGTVLRNENGVGLSNCIVDFVRAIETENGGVWGLGAANTINAISLGGCGGWAIHDGYTNQAPDNLTSPSRNRVGAAELDEPENGICLNNSKETTIEKIRINHRYHPDIELFWPLTAILIRGEASGSVTDCRVEVRHRIDPQDPDLDESDRDNLRAVLGDFCNLGGSASVGNVVVRQTLQDNTLAPNAPASDRIDLDTLVSNTNANALAKVYAHDQLIFDGVPPRMCSATYNNASGGTLTLPNSGYGTTSGILAFNLERFDPFDDYDPTAFNDTTNPGGYGFTVPYDGYAEVNLNMVMTSTTATRLQLGVIRRRVVNNVPGYSSSAMRRYKHVADSTVQSYQFTQVIPVIKGDILYAGADQNGSGSVTTTGIFSIDDIQFQVRMV
jgi:hypothetical protein